MFRRRLTWFWVLLAVLALAIVARLAQIQIAQAGHYDALGRRILTQKPQYLPAPRGSVCDRHGTPLLSDQATFDICIHYGVLAGREDYLAGVARALRKQGDTERARSTREVLDDVVRPRIQQMWQRLAELTGQPYEMLAQRAAEARERVDRIRERVRQRNPTIRAIEQEEQLLPVLESVPADVALAVRLEQDRYPWLGVTPGSQRVACPAECIGHVLGRMGAASPDAIADDPLAADELRGLRPGERCGVSGVERLGETSLRGWRGRVIRDVDGRIREQTNPVPGRTVQLTIDLGLQRDVYDLLAAAVAARPEGMRAGAAAVVLDVTTREVLALVSYPGYAYESFNAQYDELRRDRVGDPLLFRAVRGRYPPGSTCKLITLIGGLTEGVVGPDTYFACTGHLLPDKPDQFRCWIYNQHGAVHPEQNGESAIRNSCNIYFFHVGERLGPQRLCDWCLRCGLGRTQGTGLIEESAGIVPTNEWLERNQGRRLQTSDAWNFAIGQGEIAATPLQAANVAATVAAGCWAPVHLAYDSSGQALGTPFEALQPLDEKHIRIVRRGMWRVVNEKGTGRLAQLDLPGYELCGKTGSAQAEPAVLNYRFTLEWPDGQREEVVAVSEEDALATYAADPPRVVGRHAHDRFPAAEDGKRPAHAWFLGYTQAADTPRGAAPRGRAYALSVLVEFGESGGQVAAVVGKQIAERVLAE